MKRLVTLSMLAVCGSAMAQLHGPGAGGIIPDATGTPTVPGVFMSTIVVTGQATIATFDWVRLNDISHTWVGDLHAQLAGPNGNSVDIFARPGFTGAGFGNSADLLGTYSFGDGGAAFPGVTSGVIAPGSYARSSNGLFPGPSPATHASFASAFDGSNPNGTWTLTISDNAGGDTGDLRSWDFQTTPVPEPATMAALGLGAAALMGRRKRKA